MDAPGLGPTNPGFSHMASSLMVLKSQDINNYKNLKSLLPLSLD